MHVAEDEEQSGEEWCEENGVIPAGEPRPVITREDIEAWLDSLPAEVAKDVRAQLDAVEEQYIEGLSELFQQTRAVDA